MFLCPLSEEQKVKLKQNSFQGHFYFINANVVPSTFVTAVGQLNIHSCLPQLYDLCLFTAVKPKGALLLTPMHVYNSRAT